MIYFIFLYRIDRFVMDFDMPLKIELLKLPIMIYTSYMHIYNYSLIIIVYYYLLPPSHHKSHILPFRSIPQYESYFSLLQ